MSAFKIGLGEADNLPLIRHIARFGKPVIMSTGMQSIETIKASVDILVESGVEPPPLKWSAPIVRKWRTINGHQETQARRDCREVTAG